MDRVESQQHLDACIYAKWVRTEYRIPLAEYSQKYLLAGQITLGRPFEKPEWDTTHAYWSHKQCSSSYRGVLQQYFSWKLLVALYGMVPSWHRGKTSKSTWPFLLHSKNYPNRIVPCCSELVCKLPVFRQNRQYSNPSSRKCRIASYFPSVPYHTMGRVSCILHTTIP